ncbi:MAG: GDSL-type esterase/lipase family protein [Deltaproteobacteria bacterium]|jgi:lysophospholipase L1-like esterase|nr:GDSL-type esterase/lipase family protein [Deltaproteobacteria bacterium]
MSQKTIVMLGDSLTEFSTWDRVSPQANVKNQGRSGDTTHAVLFRLNQTVHAHPDLIFLQVGINDLSQGRLPQDVLETQKRIWRELENRVPQARLVVCSLVPINVSLFNWPSPLKNDRITETNTLLAKEAKAANLDFVDLFSPMVSVSGSLPESLTEDGLHLTAPAYDIWVETLQNYLKENPFS